jgi:hypothetical protein
VGRLALGASTSWARPDLHTPLDCAARLADYGVASRRASEPVCLTGGATAAARSNRYRTRSAAPPSPSAGANGRHVFGPGRADFAAKRLRPVRSQELEGLRPSKRIGGRWHTHFDLAPKACNSPLSCPSKTTPRAHVSRRTETPVRFRSMPPPRQAPRTLAPAPIWALGRLCKRMKYQYNRPKVAIRATWPTARASLGVLC